MARGTGKVGLRVCVSSPHHHSSPRQPRPVVSGSVSAGLLTTDRGCSPPSRDQRAPVCMMDGSSPSTVCGGSFGSSKNQARMAEFPIISRKETTAFR